jgi:hypothetical protein
VPVRRVLQEVLTGGDHACGVALMWATTACGRDVVRPRLPHRLRRQRQVGGVMVCAPHELVVRKRGDGQLVTRRQRAPYRSTFMTYFGRSESSSWLAASGLCQTRRTFP